MNKNFNVIIADYIKFRLKSVNAHGLHSPFMYKLATQCYYDKTKYPAYKKIKEYHKELAKNKQIIKVADFGAGSKKFKTKQRSIKDIANISGSSYKDLKILYRLSKYFQPKNILELGTSLGKSSYALSLGNPNANIITVEGDANIAQFTHSLWKDKQINIQLINNDFDTFLKKLNHTNQKFDMIIIDGDHRLNPTIKYFNQLAKHIHNQTVVLIDDIYWSDEMKQAWQTLIQHPIVRQSVNSFYFGLLFFRKEQFKQDFFIRL